MNQTTSVPEIGTQKEAREQLEFQLAQYLEAQPESTQSLHRWMKRLEVAGVGIIVATFIVALYVSVAWKSVNPIVIPIAWFIFAGSASPAIMLVGLHTIFLRAFPPISFPGKPQKFVTGHEAMWTGGGLMLIGLVLGAFWGFFAYAVATLNLAMLEPLISILGVVLGVGIAISIFSNLIRRISRSR